MLSVRSLALKPSFARALSTASDLKLKSAVIQTVMSSVVAALMSHRLVQSWCRLLQSLRGEGCSVAVPSRRIPGAHRCCRVPAVCMPANCTFMQLFNALSNRARRAARSSSRSTGGTRTWRARSLTWRPTPSTPRSACCTRTVPLRCCRCHAVLTTDVVLECGVRVVS